MKSERIAIISAFKQELSGIIELVENSKIKTFGRRDYIIGSIAGIDVVLCCSMWGKVAAAVAAVTMIQQFNISKIIFIGVAGALKEDLKVGDIIVSRALYQHDFDARPLVKRYQLPIINQQAIYADKDLAFYVKETIEKLIPELKKWQHDIRCFIGDIATGDQVIATKEARKEIAINLSGAFCVEMEGGAVAQVCAEERLPFVVIRGISDDFSEENSIIPYTVKCWKENSKKIIFALLAGLRERKAS